MKIAIHHGKGYFCEPWIKYCETNNISYKLVNCYETSIIRDLNDCDALMWHYLHDDYKDFIFAKQLLFSLEQAGKKVFPDFNTSWHFNDKVGQKYLLECIGTSFVSSYIFYTKEEALEWANVTTFPKVFKLRGGAGSANVKLVKNKKEAIMLIKKAFGKGFPAFDRLGYFKERFNKFRNGKDTFLGALKGFGRLFIPVKGIHLMSRDKGYIYFQEFIPNNNSDTRIIVIGNNAFAIKRMVRDNDFRASGSGSIIYEKEEIDNRCLKIAFDISDKLNFQCMTYDFVFDQYNNPLIVEISYGFTSSVYVDCPGFWDKNLNWYEGKFNPYGWMVESVMSSVVHA